MLQKVTHSQIRIPSHTRTPNSNHLVDSDVYQNAMTMIIILLVAVKFVNTTKSSLWLYHSLVLFCFVLSHDPFFSSSSCSYCCMTKNAMVTQNYDVKIASKHYNSTFLSLQENKNSLWRRQAKNLQLPLFFYMQKNHLLWQCTRMFFLLMPS